MASSSRRSSAISPYTSPLSSPSFGTRLLSPNSTQGSGTDRGYFARQASASSFNGSVIASNTAETMFEGGRNAISVLVQAPAAFIESKPYPGTHNSTRPPNSRDIPPVTLKKIPHVDPATFDTYLRQAGSLYEVFQKVRDNRHDHSFLHTRSRSSSKAESPLSSPRRLSNNRQASSMSIGDHIGSTVVPVLDKAPSEKRRNIRRRGLPSSTPLSIVPAVYFDPDFHLENPRIFDVVSEKSEIVTTPDDMQIKGPNREGKRKALATNVILQEKLSWYMDTVEIHLITAISTASNSFFAALGYLRALHQEASSSVEEIKALRQDLAYVNETMAQGGMKIATLKRRRENIGRLDYAVQQLKAIVGQMDICERQVEKEEIEAALDGLSRVEALICGADTAKPSTDATVPPKDPVNLQRLQALQGIDNEISYLRRQVGKAFEQRFLDALLGDLRGHIDIVPADVTFERWHNTSNRGRGKSKKPLGSPAYLQISEALRSSLEQHLQGLANAGCLKEATASYREGLLREIKSLIRKHLPSSNDDDMESTVSASTQGGDRRNRRQEKSSILARNLRDLEPEDAEEMLRRIYSNVGEALRRLSTQVKVVLDITSSFSMHTARPPSSHQISKDLTNTRSPEKLHLTSMAQQEEIQQTLDMSDMLEQCVDIAQVQITKVLKVRADQNIRLALPSFLRYFALNRAFADECEAVSGRSGAVFKSVVHAHIQEFVKGTESAEKRKLLEAMDADKWDAKDFGEQEDLSLQHIILAATQEVDDWSKCLNIWINLCGGVADGAKIAEHQTSKEKVRSAVIDDQQFVLPASALAVLSGISHFEQIICGIPSMTLETTNSLVDYLRLFNSRTSQLILGAGATRSAGLRNITTKHLAIASRALSFVTALIPYIRECVRRHQTNSQALAAELDKLKRLYQEHQSGINDKLIDIMSSRVSMHVHNMRQIEWDVPTESSTVSPYMETLIKETSTLYKVLSKHMPGAAVQPIMGPVFLTYRDQWTRAFGEAAVETTAGLDRLIRDAEAFQVRLSKIDGFGDIGDGIVDDLKSTLAKKVDEQAARLANVTDQPCADSEDVPEEATRSEPAVKLRIGSADDAEPYAENTEPTEPSIVESTEIHSEAPADN